MKTFFIFLALFVCLLPAWAQIPTLRGTITDPSGAAAPGATVQLRGVGREKRATTSETGEYVFPSLPAGTYRLRVVAKGFSVIERSDFAITGPRVFDARLSIATEPQVINVDDDLRRVTPEPGSNGNATVVSERQIAALSDDPDELALQLQALAGPAPGPGGGQIYIDGFTGGALPSKSAIREIRINANPFSPEYDRPGFSRIDIFTKPGSESFRGQAFAQYNGAALNSRNPLLQQSTRPPYRTQFYGLNLTGPIRKNRASFTLDADHRQIDENAFVLATTLDSGLNPLQINQAVGTPQSRTMIAPRLDYALSRKHTLLARYQELHNDFDNQGVGDFNLPSRAYNERQSEQTAQITETATLSARTINETRVQFLRAVSRDMAGAASPAILVQGAFYGGGASVGNSGTVARNWEISNLTSFVRGRHTLKWGGRTRRSALADTSASNFAGAFTFFTLDQYRAALAGQPGARPSQFSLNAGTARTDVNQADAGLFVSDDWRLRTNLTLSYGLRYESQSNLGERADWAPRLGVAWGLDGKGAKPAKTVVRAGAGVFYDRIPLSVTLNRQRYDGSTQRSYLILDPDFFPSIPTAAGLQAQEQPQQLRPVARGIRVPRLYQASLGIERQLNSSSRFAVTWIESRGDHLLDIRNVNSPIGGVYPFGDRSIRLLTESGGQSRQHQLMANTNIAYKRLSLVGSYTLSYGKDNNEGLPADPYNLRGEWGPSSYGDLRHRAFFGATLPAPGKFSVSPFFVANSGQPFNITTGLDPLDTGSPTARPSIDPGVGAANCQGSAVRYAAEFGCFQLQPAPGSPVIGRNYGRGPAAINVALRLSRSWAFGPEAGAAASGNSHGGMPAMMGGGAASTRKYVLTFSASTMNALNHPNFAPPNGDLSSPYFGQYRSLGGLMVMSHGGGASSYNRKIDLQIRFAF